MLHRRTATRVPTTPPVPQDVEQVDVTRVEFVFDTGLGLSFDLEPGDTITDQFGDGNAFMLKVGNRTIAISKARILYSETRPAKMNRVRPSGSI